MATSTHALAALHPAPSDSLGPPAKAIVIGVCAMDIKARSRAMQEILTRVVDRGGPLVEVKVFGDNVILDEGTAIRSWEIYSLNYDH